jgi:hypothetical protein
VPGEEGGKQGFIHDEIDVLIGLAGQRVNQMERGALLGGNLIEKLEEGSDTCSGRYLSSASQ